MQRIRNARNCGEQAERNVHQEKNGEAISRRGWWRLIGARERVALGGKDSHPAKRERNARSQQESHHEKCREPRVQVAKRREQVEHGSVHSANYFAAKSLRATTPPFMTNFTFSRTGTLSSGLPSTA